ncbi:hypothetical protein, partial [Microbacterium sp. 5K110]|uniref:hypothetical protein n=1 Tax=Microbacterium sp. 5K110 TaxID=2578104 RepID=UPI001BB186B8
CAPPGGGWTGGWMRRRPLFADTTPALSPLGLGGVGGRPVLQELCAAGRWLDGRVDAALPAVRRHNSCSLAPRLRWGGWQAGSAGVVRRRAVAGRAVDAATAAPHAARHSTGELPGSRG